MTRTRAYTSASLCFVALMLASASWIHAKPKGSAKSAMDACDRKLAADWTFCEGSKDSATRRKCDENAEARWKRCYENAGWVFSTQGQPKMPTRRPQAVSATAASTSTTQPLLQRKPAPTPRPSPKKGVWIPQGPRQTGSHMR